MDEPRVLTIIFPGRRGRPDSRIMGRYTPLGGNLYRLDEGCLCGQVYFRDIIEADLTDEKGGLTYRRQVRKAGLKRDGYLNTYDLTMRPGFGKLFERFDRLDGCAEVDLFGGVVPPLKPNTG